MFEFVEATTGTALDTTVGFNLGLAPGDVDGAARSAVDRVLGRTVGVVGDCRAVQGRFLGGLSMHVARGPRMVPGWHLRDAPEGTGISTEPDVSRTAAVAEAVEAYCGAAPVSDDLLIRASFAELGVRAVAPAHFAWPSEAQYDRLAPRRALAVDRVVDWIPAWSLTRRRHALVPAGLVFSDRWRHPPNDALPELTSTGLACHVSLTHAVLGGLCEVLERDALAVTWYNRLPVAPLAVNGTTLEPLLGQLQAEAGVIVRLFCLPTDGPFPVVLALARPGDGPPFAAVGVACRSQAAVAATKAVVESSQVLLRLDAGGHDLDPDDDAAARYATAEGAEVLDECLTGPAASQARPPPAEDPAASPAEDLARALRHLAANSLEVLVVELTTPDIAAAGWRVVRVLVPGTVWPGSRPDLAPLGAPRLYQLPVDLGLQRRPLTEDELRTIPVPLA